MALSSPFCPYFKEAGLWENSQYTSGLLLLHLKTKFTP